MSTIIKEIIGKSVYIPGNDIDTDQITPARFLKEITFEKMGHYLFYDNRFDTKETPKPHPLNELKNKDASVFLVDKNFGCGSSREHAPQSIKRYGIKAIIGISFAEIFSGNCKAIGLPVLIVTEQELETLKKAQETHPKNTLKLNLETLDITIEETTVKATMAKGHQEAFIKGTWDIISTLEAEDALIKKTNDALPYAF